MRDAYSDKVHKQRTLDSKNSWKKPKKKISGGEKYWYSPNCLPAMFKLKWSSIGTYFSEHIQQENVHKKHTNAFKHIYVA